MVHHHNYTSVLSVAVMHFGVHKDVCISIESIWQSILNIYLQHCHLACFNVPLFSFLRSLGYSELPKNIPSTDIHPPHLDPSLLPGHHWSGP